MLSVLEILSSEVFNAEEKLDPEAVALEVIAALSEAEADVRLAATELIAVFKFEDTLIKFAATAATLLDIV